jgi:hypothetical protein
MVLRSLLPASLGYVNQLRTKNTLVYMDRETFCNVHPFPLLLALTTTLLVAPGSFTYLMTLFLCNVGTNLSHYPASHS